MTETFDWLGQLRRGWGGARTYDLKCRLSECAFPLCDRKRVVIPSEVWITSNL
uniref:Uncharacterized protein n=1 Tax=Arundo donax TaxID=35708 RepID=A0A0A9EJW2_ARUDO